MFRKLLCSVVVMAVAITFVAADEFTAVIKKVDDKGVTFAKTDKKGKAGDDQTLPAVEKVTVNKGTSKKGEVTVGDAIDGGLKAEVFTKIGEKGLQARITTDADNKKITAVVVIGKKGK